MYKEVLKIKKVIWFKDKSFIMDLTSILKNSYFNLRMGEIYICDIQFIKF